ncbi:MAG: 3-dehydroquinate synthase II [Candidatus Thalassarchaeaceae archaeon]|nr:3-dehydroquinate synthase II [Candidatus Thalassarchaeaceae archaeon]
MELWLDAASFPNSEIMPCPAERVLLARGDSIPSWVDNPLFACDDGRILDIQDAPIGAHVDIGDSEGQDAAKSLVGMVKWLVLTTGDWQMIPLENLVATAQGSGTMLVARINSKNTARGAGFALQTGVDALLLPPDNEEIWAEAQDVAAERLALRSNAEESAFEDENSELVSVEVLSIEDGGVGDRICVDLTSSLKLGEGLLIGSSASALTLVHGETMASEFVPSRPFRVNAGAVHAYVQMGNGSTKYLCELVAGDEVTVCDCNGNISTAIVGRLKIESRPFLIVRFRHSESGIIGQTFLQQAETVRLISSNGGARSVTELTKGEMLLAMVGTSARHIGKNVLSKVEER